MNSKISTMLKPKPYKLYNTIQHYDWGAKGKKAFIPSLLNIKAEKDKPYAELWMGAHPKASSLIVIDGKEIKLLKAIQKYPIEILGSNTAKRLSNTLPFLFKVLSANDALSIQTHPNKRQAVMLHKKDPVNYPDSNQKHEIAIALDSLMAVVGFKSYQQIFETLKENPEIREFIGNDKKSTKSIIQSLIKKSITDGDELKQTIVKLSKRIKKKKDRNEIEKHFLALRKKYNTDVGLLILFFLNLVHLKKGEAIFTKPGITHAYLKGNILECMSNSDNVIRAGLTPKHKDIDSLLKVLTYELSLPKIIRGKKQRNSLVYQTEAKEFQLKIYSLNRGELKFKNQSGPRILLVLNGSIQIVFHEKNGVRANKYSKGESVFLPSILSDYKLTAERSASLAVAAVPQKNMPDQVRH
jgi:mannose-6-phosphate isomerase